VLTFVNEDPASNKGRASTGPARVWDIRPGDIKGRDKEDRHRILLRDSVW
jgi:hypothetical protein